MVPTVNRPRAAILAMVLAAGLCAGSCRRAPDNRTGDAARAGEQLAGRITVDGSSTVFPVARTVSERFQKAQPAVTVSVTSSSTSDGFSKLCAGQLDIAAASRPINTAEIRACRARAIDFIELPVAFDSLAIVVNPKNTSSAASPSVS
jgi:phosphate transport system substrate-binding protein